MAKLNWRDVGFLAEEVAEQYGIGHKEGTGARLLAVAWCLRMKPGFDIGKFVRQIDEILNGRGIAA
ncbi:hypothetical protein LCGC14_1616160 [marine sediment metagenome]|uniref:Uncharacterized protein n=1 Tax=marine sediment metagenome TaxID=412755 RepID=A0A0F9L6T4_9ZZZZ